MSTQFKRSTRRLIILLISLPVAIIFCALIYKLGMEHLEGTHRTFWQALEWASETITTTGYGGDNRWHHPLMNLFVVLTQIFGLFLLVLMFPVYVLPFFEERFESRLARSLPRLEGRVLLFRFTPAVESLVEELRRVAIPFVILEEDEALARTLRDRGYDVVLGRLEEQANLLSGVRVARALVTNANDHSDATFIMMAREDGFEGQILALAEDPLHRRPMLQIGADAVFTPTHVLGGALAARASLRISPRAEGLHLLGKHVALAEFRVHANSPLAGKRLGELQMRARHGVTLIGAWVKGKYEPVGGPETRIEAGSLLVAVGAPANLVKVEQMATPIRRRGPIVVAGYGTVGHKVVEMLRDAGEQVKVIDQQPGPDVDVVGNLLEHATLEAAQIREASAVVLALSNDSAGIFATAVVRDYAPEVLLIARVNRASNVARLYQVGADFALSIGQVAGRILANHLLGEDLVSLEQRLKFARVGPGRMAGVNPWQAKVRERTSASVVAVERGTQVFVEFPAEFQVHAEDLVYICGTRASLDKYLKEFETSVVERVAVAES